MLDARPRVDGTLPVRPNQFGALLIGNAVRQTRSIRRVRIALLSLAIVACLTVGRASAQTPPASITVQPGQTLSELAVRYYGSAGAASTIAAANGITDENRIISGSRLTLPTIARTVTAARTVTVQAGETLSDIAARHYGSAAYVGPLAAANRLKDADFVRVGDAIALPATLNAPVVAAVPTPSVGPAVSTGRGICLDPGHGGADPGTSFRFNDGRVVRESDVTLDMSLALAQRLRARGYAVTLTRDADTTLELADRAYLCNRSGAAVAVSVHLNGVEERMVNGSLALYAKPIERALAELLSGLMQANLFGRGSAATSFGARPFQGRVLLYTTMPAVIVEPSFLTNPDEATSLATPVAVPGSRRDQIARSIEQGIVSYLSR